MVFVIRRREFVCVAASMAFGGAAARAEGKAGSGVYPVAVPTYQNMFVAQAKGFFKDEGWDFKLIQGGSGVKTREILASKQGDFAIADIQHVLQLNKNGRPTRALMSLDQRAPGVRFAIRKDLFDQGVDTVEKFAAWKRPDGKRAILGVSSLAAAHLTAVPELKAALKKQDREDIMIIVGGVVPPQDYDALYAAGAEAIFPPGTVIADAAEELIRKLNARLGHSEAAE